MSDLNRLTKAEIIKLLETSEAEKIELEEKMEASKTQIGLDMAFSRTPEELTEYQKKQREKDYIKKMTRGRWVSQKKYQEFLEEQKQRVRV